MMFNLGKKCFDYLNDAWVVLHSMRRQIDNFGYASIADYNRLINWPVDKYGKDDYIMGWTDLSEAKVDYYPDKDGWVIYAPLPTYLTKATASESSKNSKDYSGFFELGKHYKSQLKDAMDAINDYIINDYIEKNKGVKAMYGRYYESAIVTSKITPTRIVKNGPALIVFWRDGTKTIVKRKKGEVDNVYHAYTAALAKKLYGSNSRVNKIVDSIIDESKKKTDKTNKKKG